MESRPDDKAPQTCGPGREQWKRESLAWPKIIQALCDDIDCLRRELDEAKVIIGKMPKWQPFAWAPKDNATDIIAWRGDAGTFAVFWGPPELAYRDADSEQSDWCWFDSRGEDLTGNLPTLWMPLPELDDDTRKAAEAVGEKT